jgi:general secretion pathway protein B
MSYILDALRRADAERERDPARGIHAQPAAGAPMRARRLPVWAWPAGILLLVAAAGVATWQRTAPAASAPQVPAPPPVTVAVAPPAAVVMPPAPPPPVVVERVRVVAAPATAAPVAKPAAPAASQAAASAAPATERILNVAELPADVQRELPKLAITGGVYSDNASQRMLIVGGQVFNEGAELGQGVVLDQIRPRAAILRYRGYRYSVTY